MKNFRLLLLVFALILSGLLEGALVSTIGGDGLSASKKEELLRPLKEKMATQILALNPGWNQSELVINCSNPTESQLGPFYIEIGGNAIKDLSFLKKYHLDYLKVHNTGIRDLNFLIGLKGTGDLFLELEKNEHIANYSALKSVPLKGIMIKDQLSFKDTAIINEKTADAFLINTGVKELAFVKPENLKGLALEKNSLLANISQIELMKNLESISFGDFNGDLGTLLEKLPKLSYLYLDQCCISRIPRLQNEILKTVLVFKCKDLIDFSNLTGKTIEQFYLSPESNHELKSLHNVTVNARMIIRVREKLLPESLDGLKINGKLVIYASDDEFIPSVTIDYLKKRNINFIIEK